MILLKKQLVHVHNVFTVIIKKAAGLCLYLLHYDIIKKKYFACLYLLQSDIIEKASGTYLYPLHYDIILKTVGSCVYPLQNEFIKKHLSHACTSFTVILLKRLVHVFPSSL